MCAVIVWSLGYSSESLVVPLYRVAESIARARNNGSFLRSIANGCVLCTAIKKKGDKESRELGWYDNQGDKERARAKVFVEDRLISEKKTRQLSPWAVASVHLWLRILARPFLASARSRSLISLIWVSHMEFFFFKFARGFGEKCRRATTVIVFASLNLVVKLALTSTVWPVLPGTPFQDLFTSDKRLFPLGSTWRSRNAKLASTSACETSRCWVSQSRS